MNEKTKGLITLICITILLVIAISAIDAESGDFFYVNTTSQITVMGYNATYLLTIENNQDEIDTYNLTAANIDNATVVVLDPSVITLDAGCSGNITLYVTDDSIIGPYCVIVNATSQMNAAITDEIEITTAVVEE